MAAATFSRSILGTIFPLFMRQMLIGMTVQGAISLFAAIGIPLSLAGFWFVKKGPQLRENSKYAAAD